MGAFKKITPLLIARRISQIGVSTLLFNGYFRAFETAKIYAGPLRQLCVPGLNCHACPTAFAGCPIGMLQHFAAQHRFPFYMIGFLGLIGLLSGRFTCGWLCPFGLLQDVMRFFKKISIKIPQALNYGKYLFLISLVFIIPYITGVHWFSRLCPSGALMAAIPWALWKPIDPTFDMPYISDDAIGWLFWLKIAILVFFLILFAFIKRPFCRTVCPLGGIYGLFNRISIVSLKTAEKCVDCGRCKDLCPMDLEARNQLNTQNCIKCLDCTQCKYVRFHINLPWRMLKKE